MGKHVQQKKHEKKLGKILKRIEVSQPEMIFKYTLNNYNVYSIRYFSNIIGYAGIFKDGKFNYVIIDDIYLQYQNIVLDLIHDEISQRGLIPVLNPHMYQQSD